MRTELLQSLNKDTTEKEMDAKERYLYWKLRRKTQRAMFTLLLVPKLFFHTWLVHLVWIKEFL
jgi:hypothetical protein